MEQAAMQKNLKDDFSALKILLSWVDVLKVIAPGKSRPKPPGFLEAFGLEQGCSEGANQGGLL
jgi:hypothetical protein